MSAPFLVIPPTLVRWSVSRRVLGETRNLLAGPGEQGCEAVVLWLGPVISVREAYVVVAYFPRQVAYRSEEGVAVEIPMEEWTALALQLPPGIFVLAKVHSHPEEAYHSEVDATNPYLCHESAVSIIVPDFARYPLDNLDACSVNLFRSGRWIELTPEEMQQAFVIEEEDD